MDNNLKEEEIANILFNEKLDDLGNRGIISKSQKHIFKSLYGYRLSLIKQIEEENNDEKVYLLDLKNKIDMELNQYHLISSDSKVHRKTIRQNKRID